MKKNLSFILFLTICLLSCNNQLPVDIPQDNGNNQNSDSSTIILSSSSSFESQVSSPNKTYIIRDGFNLNNSEITIPSNCTLKFFGGSVYNGKINFNNTKIDGYAKFSNCSYQGTLANDEINFEWFNFENGKTTVVAISGIGRLTYNAHDGNTIQQVINCCKNGAVINIDKIYFIDTTLQINKKLCFRGVDKSEGIYSIMLQNAEYGFYASKNSTVFKVVSNGVLSLEGISVIGNTSLYINGALWEKCATNNASLSYPYLLCGVDVVSGGKIDEIHDSSFVGFTYGIRCVSGTINFIKNSYFSSNRFGFWVDNTNNFECRGCRFNTNLLNFHFFERALNYTSSSDTTPTTEIDADQIVKLGGGVYLSNCKNVSLKNCRFEFNFIHAIIDEAAENVTLDNCIFDTGTLSQIMINNQPKIPVNPETYVPPAAGSTPKMNNVTIKSSTFARGARCDIQGEQSVPGFGIVYICDKWNRGSNINFINNIVSDDMEVDKTINATYEPTVFDIYNTSSANTKLTVTGNSFFSAFAPTIYKAVSGSTPSFNIYEGGNDYSNKTILPSGTTAITITSAN